VQIKTVRMPIIRFMGSQIPKQERTARPEKARDHIP